MKKRLFLRYGVLLVALAASGSLLLQTSQSVQRKEDELYQVHQEIAREKLAIEVLNAEWAYLNSPQRLESLAKDYLDLVPPNAAEIMPDPKVLDAMMVQNEALDGAPDDLKVDVAAKPVVLRPSRKPPVVRKAPPAAPASVTKKTSGDDMSDLLGRLGAGQ